MIPIISLSSECFVLECCSVYAIPHWRFAGPSRPRHQDLENTYKYRLQTCRLPIFNRGFNQVALVSISPKGVGPMRVVEPSSVPWRPCVIPLLCLLCTSVGLAGAS